MAGFLYRDNAIEHCNRHLSYYILHEAELSQTTIDLIMSDPRKEIHDNFNYSPRERNIKIDHLKNQVEQKERRIRDLEQVIHTDLKTLANKL